MWRIVTILSASALLWVYAAETSDGVIHYRVELIRGTDSDKPPQPGSRRSAPKLVETFRGFLKWKNYWQICQCNVAVLPGRRAKVGLSNGREVEIDLTQQGKRTVEAFQNGQLVNHSTQPMGRAATLLGGPRGPDSAWFIVVRRAQVPD